MRLVSVSGAVTDASERDVERLLASGLFTREAKQKAARKAPAKKAQKAEE